MSYQGTSCRLSRNQTGRFVGRSVREHLGQDVHLAIRPIHHRQCPDQQLGAPLCVWLTLAAVLPILLRTAATSYPDLTTNCAVRSDRMLLLCSYAVHVSCPGFPSSAKSRITVGVVTQSTQEENGAEVGKVLES